MSVTSRTDESQIPYRGPQPDDMRPDLVIGDVLPDDERLWVPLADGVASRPLQFNVTHGYYVHLLRATRAGMSTNAASAKASSTRSRYLPITATRLRISFG